MDQINYGELFDYLQDLGFEDSSPSPFERIFKHNGRGIVLAFSMLDDASIQRPVRPADITSVEFRLQQEGLLIGLLKEAAQRQSGHS